MNLPKNTIDAPSLEIIESFCDLVTAINDEARRVLNAVSVVATVEAAAKVSGVGILEIPATIARIAKSRPRDNLLESTRARPRSSSAVPRTAPFTRRSCAS